MVCRSSRLRPWLLALGLASSATAETITTPAGRYFSYDSTSTSPVLKIELFGGDRSERVEYLLQGSSMLVVSIREASPEGRLLWQGTRSLAPGLVQALLIEAVDSELPSFDPVARLRDLRGQGARIQLPTDTRAAAFEISLESYALPGADSASPFVHRFIVDDPRTLNLILPADREIRALAALLRRFADVHKALLGRLSQ